MEDKQTISISTSTLIKVLLIALLLWVGYLILDILILLFVAIILASLIDPLADWFQKHKFHRGTAVIIIYIVLLGLLSVIGLILVPAAIAQFSQLSANFGHYWNKLISGMANFKDLLDRYGLLGNITNYLPGALQSGSETVQKVIGSVFGFFGGLFSLILVLVLTFYLVVEENSIKKFIQVVAPESYREYLSGLWERIKEKLGRWLRGQLILNLVVGVLSYLGLLALDVQYALILGIMAGLFETIPYAGPIFTAIVAVSITFLQTGGWMKPLLVGIVFLVIQQLENNFLVPKIMKKVVGLNPVISILALLIGFRLIGIVGALLAIPTVTLLTIIWSDVLVWQQKKP